MKKIIGSIFLLSVVVQYARAESYTISVCTTNSYDGALSCKNRVLKNSKYEVFITEDLNKSIFRTNCGKFSSYQDVKNAFRSLDVVILKQSPFILKLDDNATKKQPSQINKIDNNSSKKVFSLAHKIATAQLEADEILNDISKYDELILQIDSLTNRMVIIGVKNDKGEVLKKYVVSTGRKNTQKPLGLGGIRSITFDPIWYPTADTIKYFKEKGIELPSVVPAGDKYNYMGPVKINLTHNVKGKEVYRIHGTLNENTIGTNESGGCIRMKNKEAIELANLLKKFADMKKNLQSIKVDLL